jgi:uncharacterized protein YcsI (UPF0317 family)
MFTTGQEVRKACRDGQWAGQTSGLAYGFVQANLVILPQDWAWDFLVFAQRNPKPVTPPGFLPMERTSDPTCRCTECTSMAS